RRAVSEARRVRVDARPLARAILQRNLAQDILNAYARAVWVGLATVSERACGAARRRELTVARAPAEETGFAATVDGARASVVESAASARTDLARCLGRTDALVGGVTHLSGAATDAVARARAVAAHRRVGGRGAGERTGDDVDDVLATWGRRV